MNSRKDAAAWWAAVEIIFVGRVVMLVARKGNLHVCPKNSLHSHASTPIFLAVAKDPTTNSPSILSVN